VDGGELKLFDCWKGRVTQLYGEQARGLLRFRFGEYGDYHLQPA